jgi:hypothetical protein
MNRMTENKNSAGNREKFAFEKMTLFAVVYGKCARSGLWFPFSAGYSHWIMSELTRYMCRTGWQYTKETVILMFLGVKILQAFLYSSWHNFSAYSCNWCLHIMCHWVSSTPEPVHTAVTVLTDVEYQQINLNVTLWKINFIVLCNWIIHKIHQWSHMQTFGFSYILFICLSSSTSTSVSLVCWC